MKGGAPSLASVTVITVGTRTAARYPNVVDRADTPWLDALDDALAADGRIDSLCMEPALQAVTYSVLPADGARADGRMWATAAQSP
jgi:hypothetical protein